MYIQLKLEMIGNKALIFSQTHQQLIIFLQSFAAKAHCTPPTYKGEDNYWSQMPYTLKESNHP